MRRTALDPTFTGMRHRLLACALAAVCALVLVGCGGGDSGGTAVAGEPISLQELARSASSSADASSGRFAFNMNMTFPGLTEPFAFSGEGAFDTTSDRASITMDMSSLASLLGGLFAGMAGSSTGTTPDFDDPSAWMIEAVQDGTVSYMRFPALDSQLPSGKSWVRTDANDAAGQGFDFTQFEQFTSNDLREVLDFLKAASGEIETVGMEELRGVQTTHYRATIDPAAYEKLAPAATSDEARSLLGELTAQSGLGKVPVEIWVDGSGLVRKLTMAFSATQPGTTETAEGSMTFELYDYGENVVIELPPASQVVDASAVTS